MKYELVNLLSKYKNSLEIEANLIDYADKLCNNARIITIFEKQTLGFIAFYCNDFENKTAFISMIVVDEVVRGGGYGQLLLDSAMKSIIRSGFDICQLEVLKDNYIALSFYEKNGFDKVSKEGKFIKMQKSLK